MTASDAPLHVPPRRSNTPERRRTDAHAGVRRGAAAVAAQRRAEPCYRFAVGPYLLLRRGACWRIPSSLATFGGMPLDPGFVGDCPYGPEGLLLDDVLEVDRETSRIVVSMPTHADLPITRTQRTHPVHHPSHVSGGLMVHMTGMAGFAHAYYLLGLRHREGWVGYGGRIYRANFRALAPTGAPLRITCAQTSVRRGARRIFSRYAFEIHQGTTLVYDSEQAAMWMQTRDTELQASP